MEANHLERQPRLDLLLQRLGNNAIELGEDLHGELGVDALLADQLVQGICQGDAETAWGDEGMCQPTAPVFLYPRPSPPTMRPRRPAHPSEMADLPSMAIEIVIVGGWVRHLVWSRGFCRWFPAVVDGGKRGAEGQVRGNASATMDVRAEWVGLLGQPTSYRCGDWSRE